MKKNYVSLSTNTSIVPNSLLPTFRIISSNAFNARATNSLLKKNNLKYLFVTLLKRFQIVLNMIKPLISLILLINVWNVPQVSTFPIMNAYPEPLPSPTVKLFIWLLRHAQNVTMDIILMTQDYYVLPTLKESQDVKIIRINQPVPYVIRTSIYTTINVMKCLKTR